MGKKSLHPPLSFLSLSHIHFSHLEQLQLLLRSGQRPQMRVLGGVGGVPDRAPDRMAGREEAGDDGRRQVARRARDADDGLLRGPLDLREGLAELRGHGAERKSNDASETKRGKKKKERREKKRKEKKKMSCETVFFSLSLFSLSLSLLEIGAAKHHALAAHALDGAQPSHEGDGDGPRKPGDEHGGLGRVDR